MSQSKSVTHFNTQDVQSPERLGGSTNVRSATHQTMDSLHAPKQIRMPAGQVGPHQCIPPLILAHRTQWSHVSQLVQPCLSSLVHWTQLLPWQVQSHPSAPTYAA